MQSASLRKEISAVTTAIQEAQRHIQCLCIQAPSSKAADRLAADIRRALEDIDALAAETVAPARADSCEEPPTDITREFREPVFVPARHGEPEFQPECDDEGVAGGWQRYRAVSSRRRRRAWV
ncbi:MULTISPECIES: hypothetical protein [unclassified Frankia]|uniref:hypothetical protein n=1 Tax=unclassified Frankia TaxID=2632575 RepID=UPI0020249043